MNRNFRVPYGIIRMLIEDGADQGEVFRSGMTTTVGRNKRRLYLSSFHPNITGDNPTLKELSGTYDYAFNLGMIEWIDGHKGYRLTAKGESTIQSFKLNYPKEFREIKEIKC